MKKIIIISSAIIFLASCGGDKSATIEDVLKSDDLALLREKRSEIESQKNVFDQQLISIDAKIAELDKSKKIPLITSFKTSREVFQHYLEFQGNVSTKNLLVLYPEFAGVIQQINVKEGDKVTKGQVLAKIDDGGLNQQLAQANIQLDLAKTTYERQKRLWDKKIGSEIQFIQTKSNYEAQEKLVSQMQEQLNKTLVKAPFTGIIDEVIIEPGALVNPGQSQLIRIINLDDMYIETDVPESYISRVSKDKKVEVEFPAIDLKVETKIGQVGNYINPANRTFRIEVPLPNKDGVLKPNLTARLRINDYTNDTALLIPQSIISENAGGDQYVYIVKDHRGSTGVAQKAIITTGKSQGDLVEILDGITEGDEVIIEGARSIQEGQEVRIK